MQTLLFSQLANFKARQIEAWNALFDNKCKYLLYGGAAHGGKSYFLRWSAVGLGMYYAQKYGIRGVPIGLFSEDYPTLKDRQIARIKKEFPPWLGQLKEDRDEGYMFQGAPEYGGFRILLRNLDDPSKYASAEFAAIFVEELTKNPEETFTDLRFRLRYTGELKDSIDEETKIAKKIVIPEVKFVGATNPGGIGHAWVKKFWIEPNKEAPDPEQDRFYFVKSLPKDNPYTTKEYMMQLESMPEAKRKAWLLGSWDVFEGQVFSEWDRELHVVKPFAIPHTWKRYIAMDWGSNKPCAIGWYAQDYEGRIYKYRELYMNKNDFYNVYSKPLTPRRLARAVIDLTKAEEYEYMVADPAMWNKTILGEQSSKPEGESIAEQMIDEGLKMIRADNDRLHGLQRFQQALSMAPDKKPWFQVFETCYHTIRTIPALVYDKHRVEDVDTDGDDHIYDEARYLIMSRPVPDTKPQTEYISPIQRDYQLLKQKLHDESDDDGDDIYA